MQEIQLRQIQRNDRLQTDIDSMRSQVAVAEEKNRYLQMELESVSGDANAIRVGKFAPPAAFSTKWFTSRIREDWQGLGQDAPVPWPQGSVA